MGSILFYFGVIFFLHGSTCSAFLPVVREIFFTFQRSIGSLIFYIKCAGSFDSVGSGIFKPSGNTVSPRCNLIAWC